MVQYGRIMDEVNIVKNKTDLVALISSFVPLKKYGQSFKANCPFHNEKSPSFVVSQERQIWHCFGCGKGGDAYSFLMEYEHVEFPEALRILAERAGITLTGKGYDAEGASKKEKIYKLNRLALEFYHFILKKHPAGRRALEYLKEERKILPQTIDTYSLGFAPSSANSLSSYLVKKKGYNALDILEAGLGTKRYSGISDFFQNRLMFPLFDHRGNVIGFSGRAISENYTGGKYINTRETLVYHKGSVFFGLNSSKEAIKKENKAIIMEGEFDTIAAFQEGIINTVAIKGTALTDDQVSLLSRFAQNVALCLDSDSAGQEAIKRSLPILEKKGLLSTIVEIPQGKDPDDAVKSDPIAFKKSIKNAKPSYEVVLNWLVESNDTASVDGKRLIGDQMLSLIAHIRNEIVKEHYLRLLSTTIDVPQDTLEREMSRVEKKETIKNEAFVAPPKKQSREESLEQYMIALIVQAKTPKEVLSKISKILTDYDWHTPSYGKILDFITKTTKNLEKDESIAKILPGMPHELTNIFDVCFLLPLPDFASAQAYSDEVEKIAQQLVVFGLRRSIHQTTKALENYEKEGKSEEVLKEQVKLTRLTEKLAVLNPKSQ